MSLCLRNLKSNNMFASLNLLLVVADYFDKSCKTTGAKCEELAVL